MNYGGTSYEQGERLNTILSSIKTAAQNIVNRLLNLETNVNTLNNNIYEVTYRETINPTGTTTGSITFPTGATLDTDDYPGNAILSTLTQTGEVAGETPIFNGSPVTATLATNGNWVTNSFTNDPVAIIFRLKIKAIDYQNLDQSKIIEFNPVGAGGNSTWGSITGILSDQTDLQNALNTKANIAGQVFTGNISATNLSGINTGDQDLSGKLDVGLAVLKSDYTPSHSILVQQSGTGSPIPLQIRNNTLIGRRSGAGSLIEDLIESEVRILLSIENIDNTSDLDKPISTATQTALNNKLEISDIADFETTAQLNIRDTNNRDRANHTGTQSVSTITGLAAVATTNNYNDLSNLPILSAAASRAIYNNEPGSLVALTSGGILPALDGSQLTNLPGGSGGSLNIDGGNAASIPVLGLTIDGGNA